MPKVSVIIPAYNAAGHIQATIDSVLNQSYGDFEVIVIDDDSTDETVNVLRAYGNRIRWKTQEHQGQAPAINHGIRMSKGDYLAYLDADDVFLPNKVEVQVSYLDEHPEVDAVYSDMYYTTPKLGTILIKSQPIDQFLLLQRCYIPRPSIMHRRSCLEQIGLFNERITGSDDWDMWVRMSERCNMAYINQPLFEYRIHGANTSFTRPKRLSYYRWTRMVILQNACKRRKKPLWLRIMAINAKIQWVMGKAPILGDKFPRLWSCIDQVQWAFERIFLRWLASKPNITGQ